MTDYFNDYNSFIAAKDLPSPADTPYETPAFIRSKRSSRATAASSREEESPSPPPLPPDAAAASATAQPPQQQVQEKVRDGRFTGSVDPRRLTPNLHASLVSEILNLRREVDAKNKLVENLETSLSSSRNENEELAVKLSSSAKEMRQAKREVQQMEKGTLDALEDLVKERDTAKSTVEELKGKLDAANKVTRRQDDDALRTQRIWESDKENWEAERRQLERRVHVTESRLRTFVDGFAAQQQQQAAAEAQKIVIENADGGVDDSVFKDSGLGNESDTASVPSVANSPTTNNRTRGHRRNHSSLSYSSSRRSNRTLRNSLADRGTPDPTTNANGSAKTGYSLADELGIDEEDEYDIDDFEHAEEEQDEDLEYPEPAEHVRRNLESRLSRQGSVASEAGSQKAMRVLGLALENVDGSPVATSAETSAQVNSSLERSPLHQELQTTSLSEKPRVEYVDTGYQPSPPSSPDRKTLDVDRAVGLAGQEESVTREDAAALESPRDREADAARLKAASPISPPETPVIGQEMWSKDASPTGTTATVTGPVYISSSTQTDELPAAAAEATTSIEDTRPKTPENTKPPASNRLSSPSLVPSIAIHPPSSRPSTPRTYVLPPRTKNAATQANISEPRSYRHASMQTELIRIDHRPVKLPPHLQPSYLLPSPNLPEPSSEVERLANRKRDLMSKFSTAPRLAGSGSPPSSMMTLGQREALRENQAQAQTQALQQQQQQSLPLSRSRSPSLPLEGSSKDNRAMPLRMIPLPRPVLSPPFSQDEFSTDGPLNRSAKYGVSKTSQAGSSRLLEGDKDSDISDYEDAPSFIEPKNLAGSLPGIAKSHNNRFGNVEPPKTVPEDKEISPDHRPDTAGSSGAAPAPSISSSRAASQARGKQPVTGNNKGKNIRSRSPSFGSMASSNQSASNYSFPGVPPFPIPTRSSSRIMPNSYSEGSQSPTPYYGASSSHRSHRTRDRQYGYASSSKDNKLRKVQSATAIRQQAAAAAGSTGTGSGGAAGGSASGAAGSSSASGRRTSPPRPRRRRHAPDLTPVQSMALDSPDPTTALPGLGGGDATPSFLLDNFPYGDIGGPVNGTGSYADSGAPPTTAESSVGAAQSQGHRGGRSGVQSQQQQQQHRDASPEPDPTNLVDAIAATMVGEWMWKYIRKRKSFGVGEDPGPLAITTEDGAAAVAANAHAHGGSRHKRWVWLSPYERCIMWDSKQPTSGSALLGKKGRRLAIQSVMDVYDETPLPRGGELASAFNRSILILTPERALKFTAVSARRHAFWITALSFLADSARPNTLPIPGAGGGEGAGILRPVPSVPSIDSVPIKRHRSPSFGRLQVRDSVRLTKGKKRFTASSTAKDNNNNAANAGPSGNTGSVAIPSSGARNSASINQTAPLPPDEPEDDEEEGAAFPSIPRLYSGTTRHQRKRSNTSPRLPVSISNSSGNAAAGGAAPAFRSASSSSGQNLPTSTNNVQSYYPSRSRNAGGAAAASSSSAAGTVASLSSTLRHVAGGIANSSSRSAGSTTAGSVSGGGGRRESLISSSADPYNNNNNSHYNYSYQYTHQPNLSHYSRDNYFGGGSSNGSGSVGTRPNFFEAVGTVRMEAFVDPNVRDGVLYVPAPPPSLLPQQTQQQHHPPQPSHPPPAVPTASRNKHSGGHHRGKGGVNGTAAAERSGAHGGGPERDTSAAGLLEEIKRKGIHLFDDVEEGSAGDPFRGF